MNEEIKQLKDKFLMYLYDISKFEMVSYIATFIQGEDAFLLRLYLNGSLSPSELSVELKITKGRVTAIINKLKTKKYISIVSSEIDRRRSIIELSDAGRTYLEEKLKIADNYFVEVFEIIGRDDAISLIDAVSSLLTKLKDAKI